MSDGSESRSQVTSDFRQRARDRMITSYVGPRAHWHSYDRMRKTPMNFVLDFIARDKELQADVIWVEGGPPELFCLPAFEPMLVIYNTSFLSLSASIRDLLTIPFAGTDLQASTAEAALLDLVAKLSLYNGDPDIAALAFARSISTENIFLHNDEERWRALEHEPISEAYMLIWFGGLAHEMGHHRFAVEQAARAFRLTDKKIAEFFELTLKQGTEDYPKAILQRLRNAFDDPASGSALSLPTLRDEFAADIYAFTTMWLATQEIMAKGGQRMSAIAFLREFLICLFGIFFTSACSRVARSAKAFEVDPDATFEAGFAQPLAMFCRVNFVQALCQNSLFYQQAGIDFSRIEFALIETITNLVARYRSVDSGFAQAMRFCLFHHERAAEADILEAARTQVQKFPFVHHRLERFCALAHDFGKSSKFLSALEAIGRDPSAPVDHSPVGLPGFIVLGVTCGDGLDQPFIFATPDGQVVLAFSLGSGLVDTMTEIMHDHLPNGAQFRTWAILVARPEHIARVLSKELMKGESFKVAVEGTSLFRQVFWSLLGAPIRMSDPRKG